MKNQYVGDAGDHGKYGMLRYLLSRGISIAVNWYLTEDDGSNDGKHTGYLKKKEEREKDPELFDFLMELIQSNKRNVCAVENSGLFGNTVFFHEVLNVANYTTSLERQTKRKLWHRAALAACAGKELVFFDPDNGLKYDTTKSLKEAVKYAFASEAADYYRRGQNIVYYCSRARRTEDAWVQYKQLMKAYLSDAKLLAITFHGGTQRSYIFVVHPADFTRYQRILEDLCESPWKYGSNRFTMELIEKR